MRAGEFAGREPLARVLSFLAGLSLFAAARALPRGPARAWWIGLAGCFALVNLYAAEARAYELMCLLCLAMFLLGLQGKQTLARTLGLTFLTTTALWTHYLALIAVAAALALAVVGRRWRSALSFSAALALFAPWVPVLRAQPPDATAWLLDPPVRSLVGFLSSLGGVGRIPAPFGPAPASVVPAAGLLVGITLMILVFRATRDDPVGRTALVYVFLVLAMALGVSLWRPIAFAGRSEMLVLAVWIWAVSRAAARVPVVRPAALAAAGLGLFATLLAVSGPHPRPTPVSAAASVARLSRPGDVVLAGPGFFLPSRLAADRGHIAARVESLPRGDASHPGWFIARPLTPEDIRDALRIAEGIPSSARLFLLLPPAYVSPALMGPLGERGALRELVRQSDGVLTVWTRIS